jgi:hypothetical protein
MAEMSHTAQVASFIAKFDPAVAPPRRRTAWSHSFYHGATIPDPEGLLLAGRTIVKSVSTKQRPRRAASA